MKLRRNYITASSSASFPLLWGVDVSYETPPMNSVLPFLPRQFSLRQFLLDVIQPPPLRSSSPSFPRHLHHHPSLAYSSSLLNTCAYHLNLYFHSLFFNILSTFVVLIRSFVILSSLVTPLIHLNILISATSNFFSCALFTGHDSCTVHHCWS